MPDRRNTPLAPDSGSENRPLATTPGDGDAPLDGPIPTEARTSVNLDDAPPESPVWPLPPDDPAPSNGVVGQTGENRRDAEGAEREN